MNISFESDGNGCRLHFIVKWRALKSALKALIPIIAAVLSLMMLAPEINKFGALLGLW